MSGYLTKTSCISSVSDRALTLFDTEIYNHSNFGILGRGTNIQGANLVVGNAGEASLVCSAGGTYNFTHSTFANYWNFGLRSLPAVIVNNFIASTNNGQDVFFAKDLLAANFNNCIIDGNNNVEFFADRVDGGTFNFNVTHSMIKFDDVNNTYAGIAELDFNDMNLYQSIVLNGFTNFRDPTNNDFIIGQDSDAINIADPGISSSFPLDILGVMRTMNPDTGAYPHLAF